MIKLRYYSLQPTTGIKVPPQILLWKSSKKQRCSKISKILKKNICKTIPFSLTSQPFSPEFPTSKKTYLKKNVSCSCSEILGKLPRELFGKNVRKTAVLRVLESCQKNVFSSKAIQVVQSATYNYTENWLHCKRLWGFSKFSKFLCTEKYLC